MYTEIVNTIVENVFGGFFLPLKEFILNENQYFKINKFFALIKI